MEFIKKNKELIVLSVMAILVFVSFLSFCKKTPLAGDDWDYAGRYKANPNAIYDAILFFSIWSGRFMSEVWCFFMNGHKGVWNLACPLLLTSIYVLVNLLIAPKKNGSLIALVSAFLMISVGQELRIETYTWVTGSCYLVPLFLTLVYFVFLKPFLQQDKKIPILLVLLFVIINLWVGVTSENIAATLALANGLLFVYCISKKKPLRNQLILFLVASVVSIIISRVSPGANYRLGLDGAEWMKLSIFEMIGNNLGNFLTYSFYGNRTLMVALSLALFVFCWVQKGFNKTTRIFFCGVQVLQLLFCLAEPLYQVIHLSFLTVLFDYLNNDTALAVCCLFYVFYLVTVIMLILRLSNKEDRNEALFVALFAGCANAIMLVSPTFGARSSLYYVFFMMVLIGIFLRTIDIPKMITYGTQGIAFIGLFYVLFLLNQQYTLINTIQQERMVVIRDYQQHWDYGDMYLRQFPLNYVHGGNIGIDDEFHKLAFQYYYELNPEDGVYFYDPGDGNQ